MHDNAVPTAAACTPSRSSPGGNLGDALSPPPHRAFGLPDDPLQRMWRLGERLRGYRGHAFTSCSFDAGEIQILTERPAGDPPRA